MSASEFSQWSRVLREAPVNEDGDSPEADLAWRAMQAIVEDLEAEHWSDAQASASEIATGIAWAAFWLAAGATAVAAILRFA